MSKCVTLMKPALDETSLIYSDGESSVWRQKFLEVRETAGKRNERRMQVYYICLSWRRGGLIGQELQVVPAIATYEMKGSKWTSFSRVAIGMAFRCLGVLEIEVSPAISAFRELFGFWLHLPQESAPKERSLEASKAARKHTPGGLHPSNPRRIERKSTENLSRKTMENVTWLSSAFKMGAWVPDFIGIKREASAFLLSYKINFMSIRNSCCVI